jgi:hypothetical protein
MDRAGEGSRTMLPMTASRTRAVPQWWALRARARGAAVTALSWETGAALVLALIVSIAVFEPHIAHGGLQSDDWSLFALDKFPAISGHTTALGALSTAAGSRVGATLYWAAAFVLFTDHVKAYLLLGVLLAALMATAIYALVRELGFTRLEATMVMIITIVAPSVDTVRFWFTPSGSQLSLTLFFVGLILALKAFDAPQPAARRLHAASLVLYIASAAYAEVALALMALAAVLYLPRAGFRRAAKRWLCDMVIVVAGYLAVNTFIHSLSPSVRLPRSQWPEHLHLIANDALTIFTSTLAPFAGSRTAVLLGLAALAAAGALAWRLPRTTTTGRAALRRWAITAGLAAVAVIVPLMVYVPSMLYYEPLAPGLGNHINISTAAPLAVLIVAVIMFAVTTLTELGRGVFSARPTWVTYPVLTLGAVWFAAVVVDGVTDVRNNANIWNAASAGQIQILTAVKHSVKTPVRNATILTFGAQASVAAGMPTFFSSFELNSAVKVWYGRSDVQGFPVVAGVTSVSCLPTGIQVLAGGVLESTSRYGQTYFVDVPQNRALLVANERSCRTRLSSFPPGLFAIQPLSWAN